MKAKFIVISGDKMLNSFMKACDVFEEGKVVGEIEHIEATYKEGTDLWFEQAAKLIPALKEAMEESGIIVSLIHLKSIELEDTIHKNTKGRVVPYFNPEVRVISNGQKWFMLHEFVKSLGLECETNEHMYITKIGK